MKYNLVIFVYLFKNLFGLRMGLISYLSRLILVFYFVLCVMQHCLALLSFELKKEKLIKGLFFLFSFFLNLVHLVIVL